MTMVRGFAACVALMAAVLPASAAPGALKTGLWPLFRQSFDLFTIVLLAGSLFAVGVIVRTVLDLRAAAIVPRNSVAQLRRLAQERNFTALRAMVKADPCMPCVIIKAALETPTQTAAGRREAAELAAAEECSRCFRRIEPLNVIGNLGPLVGLAGTVWGMVLAFTTLGASGGQASPADLSVGIAKALFHTLLGLMLAIPCLLVFGLYRSVADRLCTRAMAIASNIIESLPGEDEA